MHVIYEKTLIASRLAWPTNWSEVFFRDAPIVVEIGFGSGTYLIDLAKRKPDANVIGLEISLPSLRKAENKTLRSSLTNLRLLRIKAMPALWSLFKPSSISEIHINFPDPWSKSGHHGRRLISERFLLLAASRMKQGATLDVATDHQEYAEWITEHLFRSHYLENRLGSAFVTQDDERLRTKYELKATEAGRTCHYFKWRRNTLPVTNNFPSPEERPMPHVMLNSLMKLDQIAVELCPREWSNDQIVIRLIRSYRSVQDESVIIDTFVGEEPLEQRVLLAIAKRAQGEYQIYLHEVGFPDQQPEFILPCIV